MKKYMFTASIVFLASATSCFADSQNTDNFTSSSKRSVRQIGETEARFNSASQSFAECISASQDLDTRDSDADECIKGFQVMAEGSNS